MEHTSRPFTGHDPQQQLLLPLNLDRVQHELDELIIDSILPGHGRTLHSSLQVLVTEIKGDLATPGVWRMLEAVDPRSGPAPQTFQWAVYFAVRHLRNDLMHGWIGSPRDGESACARIRSIIASGSRSGAQLAAEAAERQRFDLPQGDGWTRHAAPLVGRVAIAFCFFVAAVDSVAHAACASAGLHASGHAIDRAVSPCRTLVHSLAVWDELVAVRGEGPVAVTYQQYTLHALGALANELRMGSVASLSELTRHVELLCATIREGLRRSHQVDSPVSQPVHSLGRRVLAPQLISKRTAARYGVSQRDLARRWT